MTLINRGNILASLILFLDFLMNFHPHFSLPVTLWQSTAHVEAKILDCISLEHCTPHCPRIHQSHCTLAWC